MVIVMSLDKAIEHKKEKRKPYHGWEAIAKSCRNHGSDPYFKKNRLYSRIRRERAIANDIKEWENRDKTKQLGSLFIDSDDMFWDEWYLFLFNDIFSEIEDF